MPTIAKLIGSAGTGKTTRLIQTMEKLIDSGVGLDRLGFVSFTRAARQEAASRAATKFNATASDLENHGWFRTLHSVCYRCLEAGAELIAPGKESREWMEGALGYAIAVDGSVLDADYAEQPEGRDAEGDEKEAAAALRLWGNARNRLEPLRTAWERQAELAEDFPEYEFCERVVRRYEQAKAVDHRSDFTDLLARFAGIWPRIEGPERRAPEGWVPALEAWILDEAQDLSPLSSAVFQRLIATPSVRYAYLAGDPFQSIFGFAGASPRPFMEWPAAKTEIMRQTYRCPKEVLALGEDVLRPCSDYFDREVAPASHAGSVEEEWLSTSLLEEIDPTATWLILARTNWLARKLGKLLDGESMPWVPTKGNGGWARPKENKALLAFNSLQSGAPVDCEEWRTLLDYIPARHDGVALLERGVKTQWAAEGFKPEEALAKIDATEYGAGIDAWGATDDLKAAIRAGRWVEFVDSGARWQEALSRWGWEAACNPKIQIGTIHSAKGAESDNVLLLNTISAPVVRALETTEGEDEERRVFYVGVTRARKRLIVAKDRAANARFDL